MAALRPIFGKWTSATCEAVEVEAHQLRIQGSQQAADCDRARAYWVSECAAIAQARTEAVGMVTSYVKTAGFAEPLHPVALTARYFTVSKQGSLPKNSVVAGMLQELLPTHSFSILAFADLRSHAELDWKPVAQDPMGVPKEAKEIDLMTPPPADAQDK